MPAEFNWRARHLCAQQQPLTVAKKPKDQSDGTTGWDMQGHDGHSDSRRQAATKNADIAGN